MPILTGIHISDPMCFIRSMFQLDMFAGKPQEQPMAAERPAPTVAEARQLDLPDVLDLLSEISPRPRYTFMVLNLIARAAGRTDSAGPYVRDGDRTVPVRDWLGDALMPMARNDGRRRTVIAQVRTDLATAGTLPENVREAETAIAAEVRRRLIHSTKSNVSRAVSDLVKAGLLHRHYQGYRVDHENRGAGREAVYTLTSTAKVALGRAA